MSTREEWEVRRQQWAAESLVPASPAADILPLDEAEIKIAPVAWLSRSLYSCLGDRPHDALSTPICYPLVLKR